MQTKPCNLFTPPLNMYTPVDTCAEEATVIICSVYTCAIVSFQVFVERCQGFKSLGAGYQERSHPVQLKAVILLTDILHEQVCSVLKHGV